MSRSLRFCSAIRSRSKLGCDRCSMDEPKGLKACDTAVILSGLWMGEIRGANVGLWMVSADLAIFNPVLLTDPPERVQHRGVVPAAQGSTDLWKTQVRTSGIDREDNPVPGLRNDLSAVIRDNLPERISVLRSLFSRYVSCCWSCHRFSTFPLNFFLRVLSKTRDWISPKPLLSLRAFCPPSTPLWRLALAMRLTSSLVLSLWGSTRAG